MRIHGWAPALNYGQQAYEGLKAFRTPGDAGITIFRPDRNAQRMQHSADVVSIPPVPVELFVQAVKSAVALNAEFVPPHETGASMYIRPQIYGSSAQLGLTAPEEYTFCVFVCPTGVYHGTHPQKALILDDFDRAAPNGTGNAKVGGNYAPVLRWSDKARQEGFGMTLHLDSKNHEDIDEFSTSGFIGVLNDGAENPTLVVPDSKCVINSVTSDSAQHLAKSFGWKVEQRPVKFSELPSLSEVFAAGTAAALVPVRSITKRSSDILQGQNVTKEADGSQTVKFMPDEQDEAGPVCVKILTALKGLQAGKVEDVFGWTHQVTEQDTKVEVVANKANGNGV